jgi:capsular polysaccharide biosynthesis protein
VKIFTEKAVNIMKKDVINVIDAAYMPDSSSRPKPVLNISIALIAGLVIGVSSALMLEFMDDTIKTSQDVEKYLGVNVLGAIPFLSLE